MKKVIYKGLYQIFLILSNQFNIRFLTKCKIFLGTSLLVITSSCDGDDGIKVMCYDPVVPPETECGCEENVTGISGKWKLEKRITAFPISMNDYSTHNITIEIQSEKTLIVHKYTSQEGLYFFEPKNYSITEENGYYTAILEDSRYGVYIYENQLFIDLSPVDGPRYIFSCIKD
ncbi:MAG: hypothetical protein LBV74_00485 [Tannerella sp.]|jgi:hypothetical protein|nr:hypothetical protein [Tannerella sp.]